MPNSVEVGLAVTHDSYKLVLPVWASPQQDLGHTLSKVFIHLVVPECLHLTLSLSLPCPIEELLPLALLYLRKGGFKKSRKRGSFRVR